MTSHLLIGKNIDKFKVIGPFVDSNKVYKTYGRNKNDIDCSTLNLPNNSHIMIYTHATLYQDFHILHLCSTAETKITINSFKEISKNKSLNIELFSCYSGAAIDDLPENSKLITVIASYLFLNPESNKFAIHSSRLGKRVFVSDVTSLAKIKLNSKNIKKWQDKQLENFINFCKKIKNGVDHRDSIDIAQLIELYEDDNLLSNWLNQFNLKRYKEIFFISMSYYNNFKVIKNLIKSSVDVDSKTNSGKTALYIASEKGHIGIVVELLNSEADINIKSNDGATALHTASNTGAQLVVAELIKRGADVHIKHTYGYTALHIASRQGHDLVVYELLKNGADYINLKSQKGLTPLYLASEEGHQPVVTELIKNGADISIKNDKDMTALHIALLQGHHSVVSELLKNGVNIDFNTEIKPLKNEIKYLYGKKSLVYKEMNYYILSPVKYILIHNDKVDTAISAIKNIERNLDFIEYQKLQDCLDAQPAGMNIDLNGLCGKDGSFYLVHSEL